MNESDLTYKEKISLDFVKPNKFKLRFTFYSILIGSFLFATFLNFFVFFHWGRITSGSFSLLYFIQNSVSFLLSNFYIMPLNYCMSPAGIHFKCFFSEMLIILSYQLPAFYLLACLLDKADWKARFWRIYLFAITLIHLYFYSAAATDNRFKGWDQILLLLDIPFVLTAFLGLYLLSFKRKLFNAVFWKAFFCIYITWEFTINILLPQLPLPAIIQSIVLFAPLYTALYLYGFKFWEVERSFRLK